MRSSQASGRVCRSSSRRGAPATRRSTGPGSRPPWMHQGRAHFQVTVSWSLPAGRPRFRRSAYTPSGGRNQPNFSRAATIVGVRSRCGGGAPASNALTAAPTNVTRATRCSPSAYSPPISSRPRRGRTSRPALEAGSATRTVASPHSRAKRRPTSTTRSSGTLTLTCVEKPVRRSAREVGHPCCELDALSGEHVVHLARCRRVPGDRRRDELRLTTVGGEHETRREPTGPRVAGVQSAQPAR